MYLLPLTFVQRKRKEQAERERKEKEEAARFAAAAKAAAEAEAKRKKDEEEVRSHTRVLLWPSSLSLTALHRRRDCSVCARSGQRQSARRRRQPIAPQRLLPRPRQSERRTRQRWALRALVMHPLGSIVAH